MWKEKTPGLLHAVAEMLSRSEEMTLEEIKDGLKGVADDAGLGLGVLMGPLRIVIVGSLSGPDLISLLNTLGAKEVIKRIDFALKAIK